MTSHINTLYASPYSLAELPKDTPVLLAFSGGADSSALLHILAEDSKRNGFSLSVAHFHHGIRGDEADRDAEFCKNAAEKYGIPFFLGSADVPALAQENKTSLEAEARAQRYSFLEKIMRENGIPILVTAHHADDLIESILIHVLRGSGISGLKGILPCRALADGLFVVRPILNAQKQHILDYCEANSIEFVNDSTNNDKSYLRNSIRSDITPKLYELQPNLPQIFSRLSQNATEADSYIDSVAQRFIDRECREAIPIEAFLSLHNVLRAKIISILFEKTCGATLERVHVASVIELCKKGVPHSSISLPNNKAAKIENGYLLFCDDCKGRESQSFSFPFLEGAFHTVDNGCTVLIEKNPSSKICKSCSSHLMIDVSSRMITQDTVIRSRCEGDVITTGKMNKKVKKLLSDKKIPLDRRSILPILVADGEILWIPSVAACDRLKMDRIKEGEDFFRVTVTFENE